MTYQWQKGTFTGNMADIPGATDATYTFAKPTLTDHLTLMRCVVSNQAGSATSASEMLFVTTAPTAPTQITSYIAVSTQVGASFSYGISATGGTAPLAYAASPLPAGLSLDPNSGQISGIPAQEGATAIVIDAANSAGHISAILTVTVTETAPAVSIDAWRLANFGASVTDPSIAGDQADPDGDGFTNLQEFTYGSNPLDPASAPAIPANASPMTTPFKRRLK